MAQEYEVLYDWEPENAEDLGLFAGETAFILEKHEHGWWLGSIERDGNLVKGYFPRNYVKEKPPSFNAPKPPPRPTGLPKAEDDGVNKATDNLERTSISEKKRSSVSRGPTFSIRSLAAFDDLSEKGYAVELPAQNNNTTTGSQPNEGDQVELLCSASIWDGASTEIKEYAKGVIKFTVGAKQVVPGLDKAVQGLKVGNTANITCAPHMAYGGAGNPPLVPPNAYIIFNVTLQAVQASGGSSSIAEGLSAFFGSGVESRRVNNADNRRSSRIVLAPVSENESSADAST